MTKTLDSVKDFLQSRVFNAWIVIGTMKAYVRKGRHLIDGKPANTFDLANFEKSEKYRGKGEFRRLIIDLKEYLVGRPTTTLRGISEIQGIYVESVLNERLAQSLPSMGFSLVPDSNPPSFYLALDKTNSKV